MSFPIEKIVVYRDYIDYFLRLDIALKREVYSPYCAGEFQSLVPGPDNQLSHTMKKITTPLFNKAGLGKFVISVAENGVFYLELRRNHVLGAMTVVPEEVSIDLYFGSDDSLIYSFYNPTRRKSISIIASISEDVDRVYEQIKLEPEDIIWRQSFIREALLSENMGKDIQAIRTPELMTAGQLAKYLKVSEKTIRNWTSLKKIPYEKIGHTIRYRKSAVDNLNKPEK
jgi:excisionase family DNA binding protein